MAGRAELSTDAAGSRWPLAGWTVLLLVGQAASLQLVRAGRQISYQHYAPPASLLGGGNAPWTALLALQICVVAIGCTRMLPGFIRLLRDRPGVWRIAFVLVAMFVVGAAPSRDPAQFAGDLALAFIVRITALANALLIAAAVPPAVAERATDLSRRLLPGGDDAAPSFWRIDRFVLAAALWATGITALLGFCVYQWHPHIPDEVVYLINAKYLAAGRLDLPLPAVPDAFNIDLMTYESARWYSPVPPGWPLVLAVGTWLGVPWLVNPLLSGLCVVASHILVRSFYDERLARISTVLLCISPWFLFLGMSLMTHQLTLAAALVAAVAAERLRRGGRSGFAVVAGAGVGLLALIRPLEGLIVALLLGFRVLLSGPLRRRLVPVTIMALAAIAVTSLTLPWNEYYTGDPTVFPIMAYTDALYGPGSNSLGFGPDRGLPFGDLDPFPGHGPADAAVNAALNSFQTETELLGWMTGSLLPILLLLASGRVRRRDGLMLTAIAAVVGAHTFYWFSGGPDFGARYWYLILVPCLALAARGLDVAAAAFRERRDAVRPLFAAGALCLGTLLVFVPWRSIDKYYHYRDMRPDVRRLIEERHMEDDLVFVRGSRMPDYMSAVPYGRIVPAMGGGAPIIAWDRDETVRMQVLRAFPDRDVYFLDGPSITGEGFRVVAGPVPASQLIAELGGER